MNSSCQCLLGDGRKQLKSSNYNILHFGGKKKEKTLQLDTPLWLTHRIIAFELFILRPNERTNDVDFMCAGEMDKYELWSGFFSSYSCVCLVVCTFRTTKINGLIILLMNDLKRAWAIVCDAHFAQNRFVVVCAVRHIITIDRIKSWIVMKIWWLLEWYIKGSIRHSNRFYLIEWYE